MGEKLVKDRYRVLRPCKKGGMSEFFLGKDEKTDKLVMLKTLPEKVDKNDSKHNIRKILQNEAYVLKALNHDGIVKYYDSLYYNGDWAIVLEYVSGCDLRALSKLLKFTQMDVIDFSIQILKILSYLHRKKVVYADLNPNNIMVGKGKKIRLVDFGLSFFSGQKYPPGLFYGTVGYAPREQYRGRIDFRSDIYSLGRTMMFMLNRENPEPFQRLNFTCNACICLLFIVERAISENPDDRYQNVEDMLRELLVLKIIKEK